VAPENHSRLPGVIVIVMGVSGCGKSTVAHLLAERLDGHFRDGDELHPPANIALMASGTPLTDEDRWPWLEQVRDYARHAASEHGVVVIACSALRQRYRDLLGEAGCVYHVFLDGSRELISGRIRERKGHFMPDSLLDTQFAALESPVGQPRVVTVDITPAPAQIAAAAEAALREHPDFIKAIGTPP